MMANAAAAAYGPPHTPKRPRWAPSPDCRGIVYPLAPSVRDALTSPLGDPEVELPHQDDVEMNGPLVAMLTTYSIEPEAPPPMPGYSAEPPAEPPAETPVPAPVTANPPRPPPLSGAPGVGPPAGESSLAATAGQPGPVLVGSSSAQAPLVDGADSGDDSVPANGVGDAGSSDTAAVSRLACIPDPDDLDALASVHVDSTVYFPSMRTSRSPRGYLTERVAHGPLTLTHLISLNGRRPIPLGGAFRIRQDGLLHVDHAPEGGVAITRTFFPSMSRPSAVEVWTVTNVSPDQLAVLRVDSTTSTLNSSPDGVAGDYEVYTAVPGSVGERLEIPPGGGVAHVGVHTTARMADNPSLRSAAAVAGSGPFCDDEPVTNAGLVREMRERQAFVRSLSSGRCVLETPEPELDTAFALAKVRTGEAVFETELGLLHSPGGGKYYGGVWANDQAEYAGPFLAWLGGAGAVDGDVAGRGRDAMERESASSSSTARESGRCMSVTSALHDPSQDGAATGNGMEGAEMAQDLPEEDASAGIDARDAVAVWDNTPLAAFARSSVLVVDRLASISVAALNSYRTLASLMPSAPADTMAYSVEVEGDYIGRLDRGDAGCYAWGASLYALTVPSAAPVLTPSITWALQHIAARMADSTDGILVTESDEMEGRFETGESNLAANATALAALRSAALLADSVGRTTAAAGLRAKAADLERAIEEYFGSKNVWSGGYRYFAGCRKMRGWSALPAAAGISSPRAARAVGLLLAKHGTMWTPEGVRVEAARHDSWDRQTLVALRTAFQVDHAQGISDVGLAEVALDRLREFTTTRAFGEHVPYCVEENYEGCQLAGESALYARVYLEGLFGITVVGRRKVSIAPRLPTHWRRMALRRLFGCGVVFDVVVLAVGTASCGAETVADEVADGDGGRRMVQVVVHVEEDFTPMTSTACLPLSGMPSGALPGEPGSSFAAGTAGPHRRRLLREVADAMVYDGNALVVDL
ncbi:hypothetical protein I4F81_002520 [Pyropia yezoensis]|uniref:Uncharacterized protein n=1 Tax=Pyropia yezoensis TaxID=2788 RepID=A0ACC3BPT3_PYRYE|nr:hypothetical protein I4F81_002520 [Neopyropia yezoensis]